MNDSIGRHELPMKTITVSIIVPVYFNELSLVELYDAIEAHVINIHNECNFEVIFIDDGSEDNSFNTLLSIKNLHSDIVKVVKLTRNFGQANAIKAGLDLCRGDLIVVISADLQDPPELIDSMLKSAITDHYDLILCTRRDRDESYYRVLSSKLFYWIMKKLAFKNMPIGGFDYLMMSKRVKDTILKYDEANACFQGQILYPGFKSHFLSYDRRERKYGTSKWTLLKKIKAVYDSIIAYSYFPIRIMTLIGLAVSLASFAYAVVIVVAYYYNNTPFQGWAPIMILILALSGIQMIMLGVIGEYLWRTLEQVRNRPQYVIDQLYE